MAELIESARLPPETEECTEDCIAARRDLLALHEIHLPGIEHGRLGIAFSGGGIRSATISLGVAQALAERDRLLDFDYMSTVSGGGYFGGFLRSLFLPQTARGSSPLPSRAPAAQSDTQFAIAVLKSEPSDATIAYGNQDLTNPVRWLRENSRYLAPAGPTDFAVGVTFILRNWLAMLFVFALPTLLFFLVIHFGLHELGGRLAPSDLDQGGVPAPALPQFKLSALFVLPALLLIVSIIFGVANWLTVYSAELRTPPANAPITAHPAVRVLVTAAIVIAVGLLLLFVIHQSWNGAELHLRSAQWTVWQDFPFPGCAVTPTGMLVASAAVLAAGAIAAALVAVAAVIWIAVYESDIGPALFGNELRRLLTERNSQINIWLMALAALALIDTIALWLEHRSDGGGLAASGLAAAAGRWLIQKLGASFGKASPSSAFGSFVGRYIWQVALVAAMLLWGGFAVLLDMLIRQVAYGSPDWQPACALALGILGVAMGMVGRSVGFINLSSLHSLYAARLTRAYLGATNRDRLAQRDLQDVTGYQPADLISADLYQRTVCAAPLHLMNITLNETISATGSQLLERDRKGVPLVVAPEGLWIDAAAAAPGRIAKSTTPTCSWAAFGKSDAEAFSVGQLTAISGAAVSSAMGTRTTLGGALLFTYANIRLGYWWSCGRIRNNPAQAAPRDWLGWTGTFGYLFREMTARYRSTTGRVNLSDGGHFDDSGVYELLRRKVHTIVYCDNGEDIGYHFEDLEILVRKARLDIGVSVEVATPAEVVTRLGVSGAEIFLNGKAGDWRARARARDHADRACALLLLVRDAACTAVGIIVLLKPSLFGSLPADLWGYAEEHVSFPHETTADQFFTEAQWESYRKLGFMMMQQLLRASPDRADLFRKL